VALVIMAMGGLFVTRALTSSEGAARADASKAQAVRAGDTCLRILSQELAQTTSDIDLNLPLEEQQRIWAQAGGVQFQKVVGHVQGVGNMTPQWSSMITYVLNPATGDLWRNQVGEPSRLMARGVTEFDVQVVTGGPITVTIATRAGAANRGTEGRHRQVVRITPRNKL
jgi:hypothetical protein